MNIIAQLIRSAIIPKILLAAENHFVVGRKAMRQKAMPEGVSLTKRILAGERKAFRSQRIHGGHRLHTAIWPQDNLHEIAVPKIVCIVSGTADFLLSGYALRCDAGNVIFIPPEMPHQRFGPFLRDNRGHCGLVSAYAFRDGIMIWYNRCDDAQYLNDTSSNLLINSPELSRLLSAAVDEVAEERVDAPFVCKSYLTTFFAVAARELEAENYLSRVAHESSAQPKYSPADFADQVRGYIEANCHRMLKVEDVARHFYMSNSYFFRQMQEHGLNFVELLTQYRMESACRLLRESDLTADAISRIASYKSITYFHNLFRKRMGCTPMEYRRKWREKSLEKISRK